MIGEGSVHKNFDMKPGVFFGGEGVWNIVDCMMGGGRLESIVLVGSRHQMSTHNIWFHVKVTSYTPSYNKTSPFTEMTPNGWTSGDH